jgi:glutamate dehydrogenase/leucine dehydrogenase
VENHNPGVRAWWKTTKRPSLNVGIIGFVGTAQLHRDPTMGDATRLTDCGGVYLPDNALNAGGLIQVAAELRGFGRENASSLVGRIEGTCGALLADADASRITPSVAADRLAERRLHEVGSLRALRGWDRSRGAA